MGNAGGWAGAAAWGEAAAAPLMLLPTACCCCRWQTSAARSPRQPSLAASSTGHWAAGRRRRPPCCRQSVHPPEQVCRHAAAQSRKLLVHSVPHRRGWELPVPLPAPTALLPGGRCRPQRPWGSSSLPPYQKVATGSSGRTATSDVPQPTPQHTPRRCALTAAPPPPARNPTLLAPQHYSPSQRAGQNASPRG